MGAYAESVGGSGLPVQKHPWLRHIQIKFTSKRAIQTDDEIAYARAYAKKRSFDASLTNGSGVTVTIDSEAGDGFDIQISGTKYLALTKDNGCVTIANMSYETIALIQMLQLYRIEIWVGYKGNELFRLVKGEVSYISQKIHSQHDSLVYITYASELVASWSQNRMNFSFRSGVNMYNAIKYFFATHNGGNSEDALLSKTLANVTFKRMYNDCGKATSVLESCITDNQNQQYLFSADSSFDDKVINVTALAEKRGIVISPAYINIGNGNPTVTSQGLDITLFPVVNFCPGDVLKLNLLAQTMIDTSSGMNNAESVSKTFNTQYLDPNGCYVIREIQYSLENRGINFYYKIRAVAASIFTGVLGIE